MSTGRGDKKTQVTCLCDKQASNSICISVRSVHVGRPPADLTKQEPGIISRNASKGRKIRHPITATSQRMREFVHDTHLSV